VLAWAGDASGARGPREFVAVNGCTGASLVTVSAVSTRRPLRAAVLLSTEYFEAFYGHDLGLTVDEYLGSYRNDWSWDWCRALRAQGEEPLIYLPSLREAGLRATPEGVVVRFLPIGRFYEPWRRMPVLKRSPPGRYVAQAANAAAFLRPLRRALATDQIDVLLVQEYWTARFDLLAGRLRVPILAVDQGLPDRHEVKLLKRRSLPRAERVLTQTKIERDKVVAYGASAERLPNGVDTERWSSAAGDGSDGARSLRTVLTVARLLDMQKRTSDLIAAIALLGGEWRLRILGGGPDEAGLRAQATRLGVEARVAFLGFTLDKERVRDECRSCSVFALPSAYEGLPMALLEAMSCGVAVVASDIPAIAEVVTDGHDGLLVPVGDPARLAERIEQADARRAELGAAARETIELRYSQGAMARRLVEVMETAVASG
jgi:glycosyltransferase involved in cell wall biosynthesis